MASTHKDNNEIPLRAKEVLPGMVGGHKKVISYFLGNGWLRSRRFLFQQFFHGDKAHKVIGNADALMPLAAGLVRGFNVDCLDKFPQRIGVSSSKSSYLRTRWINCSKFSICRSCTSISCCKVWISTLSCACSSS